MQDNNTTAYLNITLEPKLISAYITCMMSISGTSSITTRKFHTPANLSKVKGKHWRHQTQYKKDRPPFKPTANQRIYRGSYISAHVLLNLLNELRKTKRCEVFSNEFNKFNNIGAQMQDSIYHMTLKSHFISNFVLKRHDFATRKRGVLMDVNA